ncbi:MAG: 16S rRNA (adenine(1518)-N(6)/adenine(1519)-N(6))-dimethyltransferase RsmA [Betaproteobacteria bacterium]|nr:16S rRNA (adenine(1518)-N(6)/adenine(1519)-N(6))-dimethyltransferase RsmA [Rhodocyclaceae bacterium]MCA3134059.1 16S rRNA (adenine(1518)-N(6)/adenine(1519)-N(6))-dimethyltransferase RsmA [Rhodocyclaceae bacterium]MCA3142649.1 16S rRNA (adenine(1518)-N(6)/adenine(1519)-N(6))-dimethyltransferase RsmA [Rhodocyclaceae bacterium]MCA3144398.1 16S rRNA (adenine(1518)-N(6)/adenine(1519)-N(6))-dimethyltransferase RsmA [Rhodocyclaceae bacterium]MCE2897462.1 16S rRNA (adenine(1518)-N(6)/adenine(1519)-N
MTAHVARKRFGQHFLVDATCVRRIVEAVAPQPDECVVEIGPGLGALTTPLLTRVDRLHVVEIDRDIVAKLRARWPPERLVVHEADALKFDFAALGNRLRLVGNLPYNISTPLLFRVAGLGDRIADAHFMLQKEVVDRMVAMPGSTEYGRLTVMLQYRFAMHKLFEVGPEAFRPPPKVDSAVVLMRPLNPLPQSATDPVLFAQVVTRAFTQRRKTLRNALAGMLEPRQMALLGIDPGARPETLPVAAWVAAANWLSRRDSSSE